MRVRKNQKQSLKVEDVRDLSGLKLGDDVTDSSSISRTLGEANSFSKSSDSFHHLAEFFNTNDRAQKVFDIMPEPKKLQKPNRPMWVCSRIIISKPLS